MARTVLPLSIVRHPIYSMMLPVPVVCFIGGLLTDWAYLRSDGNLLWVNFSTWLLAAGLISGAIAAGVLLVDLIRGVAANRGLGWAVFALFVGAWIVEFINSLVHARDGWTAVEGTGFVLSVIGALLILIAAWLSRDAIAVRP